MTRLLNATYLSPYIIAEAGVNHEGDLNTAFEMVRQASINGAHAIKFQFYKASKIASVYASAYWDTSEEPSATQYQLFQKYDSFNIADYERIYKCCQSHKIDFMCSAFDLESLAQIDPYVAVHKIASADITYLDMLRKVSGYGKPVILSTGASTDPEIETAIKIFAAGNISIFLLHCVLSYPTPAQYADLSRIKSLQQAYKDIRIGYSDHTLPEDMHTCLVAACLGALVIEKHFTLDKDLKGNDHYHSMDPSDLSKLVRLIERTRELVLSSGEKAPLELQARLNARRSAIASIDIPRNSRLTSSMVSFKRPGTGIQPGQINEYFGKMLSRDVMQDEILTPNMFLAEP